MKFEEVIGQQETKQQLLNMVKQNRLSHALLFLGKEGSGALPLAFAFAQYVVCEAVNGKPHTTASPSLFGVEPPTANHHQPTANDSCGTCPACIKAQQYIHPDIHFSYPVIPRKSGDKPLSTDYISEWREFIKQFSYGNVYDWLQFIGAENKQGNITAHECNDIIRQMNLKSFESEYKILIMWMPEYLGNEGNKLLKLIEEPPPKTLLIFVAENDNLILPTILSRLQLVKIAPLHEDDISRALIKRAAVNENTASQVASVAEGNYREALQLIQHSEEDWQSLIREWLNSMLKTGPVAQVKWIEEVAKLGREKQKQFLRYFNHLLEQGIRLRLMNSDTLAMPAKDRDFAERLNKVCSVSQQKAIIEELDRTSYYIERNANAKILFHALTLRISHIIRDNSLILVD